ncbi:MAG: hypothetical protein JW986_01195 [Methanotrichaceae archaeon]|nr:hypothetical protein [Methanotrichaceae archaeon]
MRFKAILLVVLIWALYPACHAQGSIGIEHVAFTDTGQERGLLITLRNLGDESVMVDRVYIDQSVVIQLSKAVEPWSASEIDLAFPWEGNRLYEISLATTEGISANISARSPSMEGTVSDWVAFLAIALILFFFGGMIVLGFLADRSLDGGELRRAAAGTLIFVLCIVAILSLRYNILRDQIISSFLQVVGMVAAFYYGSKIASKAADVDEVEEEEVKMAAPKAISLKALSWSGNEVLLQAYNNTDHQMRIVTAWVNDEPKEIEGQAIYIASKGTAEICVKMDEVKPNKPYRFSLKSEEGVWSEELRHTSPLRIS